MAFQENGSAEGARPAPIADHSGASMADVHPHLVRLQLHALQRRNANHAHFIHNVKREGVKIAAVFLRIVLHAADVFQGYRRCVNGVP